MRFAPVFRRFLPALIVTALPACDNVELGKAEFQVVPPPPAGMQEIAPDAQTFVDLGLPSGTVLFHAVKGEGSARLIPVAEVSGDSLRTLRRPAGVAPEAYEGRFREAVLEPGAQFELFRRGASVGTFQVGAPGPVTACGVPTATGSITTVAAAADAGEFLAFRRGLAPEVRGEYSPPQVTGSMRSYASIVAERLVLQNGLPRPRSWPGAQRALEPLELVGGGNPEMAATYLVGDQLAAGPGEPDGYSIFYIAGYDRRSGYTPFYSEVHDYRRGGKVAPRLVDYLNWNAREEEEVLVELFGPQGSRYEAIGRTAGGDWERVWQSPDCAAVTTSPAR